MLILGCTHHVMSASGTTTAQWRLPSSVIDVAAAAHPHRHSQPGIMIKQPEMQILWNSHFLEFLHFAPVHSTGALVCLVKQILASLHLNSHSQSWPSAHSQHHCWGAVQGAAAEYGHVGSAHDFGLPQNLHPPPALHPTDTSGAAGENRDTSKSPNQQQQQQSPAGQQVLRDGGARAAGAEDGSEEDRPMRRWRRAAARQDQADPAPPEAPHGSPPQNESSPAARQPRPNGRYMISSTPTHNLLQGSAVDKCTLPPASWAFQSVWWF